MITKINWNKGELEGMKYWVVFEESWSNKSKGFNNNTIK